MQHIDKRKIKPYPVSKEINHIEIIFPPAPVGIVINGVLWKNCQTLISLPNYVSLYKASLRMVLWESNLLQLSDWGLWKLSNSATEVQPASNFTREFQERGKLVGRLQSSLKLWPTTGRELSAFMSLTLNPKANNSGRAFYNTFPL